MTQQQELFRIEEASEPTEAQKRDAAILKMMESDQRRAEILRRATEARRLSHDPTHGLMRYQVPHMVTSDMVNESLSIPGMKAKTRTRDANNINGAIFTIREEGKERFRYLGPVRSKRKNSHNRIISGWALAPYYDIARPIYDRVFDERGRRRAADN